MQKRIYENPVIRDRVYFANTSAESNGECTVLEVDVAPGGGNPLHCHREFSETFHVLEGTLVVQIGKEKKVLKQGEQTTVPKNTPHNFHNASDSYVKFRAEMRPGHEGFENSLKIAYGLATDGLTNKKGVPKKFSHLAIIVTMGGSYPTGILSLLMPVFRRAAERARRKGIEESLLSKYCK